MNDSTFKRGQVEWALWRWQLDGRSAADDPPPRFLARVRKLLELDRRKEVLESEVPHAPYAFLENAPRGTGTDLELTLFDSVCLAVGLNMLDFGFKQAEVVFFLRHIRPNLRQPFARARSDPYTRNRVFAHHAEHLPTYEERGRKYADRAIFMIVTRVQSVAMIEEGTSLLSVPKFAYGRDKVRDQLAELGLRGGQAYVIELAYLITFINQALPAAPSRRRGRP